MVNYFFTENKIIYPKRISYFCHRCLYSMFYLILLDDRKIVHKVFHLHTTYKCIENPELDQPNERYKKFIKKKFFKSI